MKKGGTKMTLGDLKNIVDTAVDDCGGIEEADNILLKDKTSWDDVDKVKISIDYLGHTMAYIDIY